MGTSIPRVPTDNADLNRYQHNVQNALMPIFNCPINFGAQASNITLQIGDNPVNFGLGRELNGWFIVRKQGTAEIFDKYSSQDPAIYPKNLTIVLNSDSVVTVSIWFY